MLGNLLHWLTKVQNRYAILRRNIHHNSYLIIGFYGLLIISAACIFIPWLAFELPESGFQAKSLLPPAWQKNGDLSHILGTDQNGEDIFYRLLYSLRVTLLVTLTITFFVSLFGTIISYLIIFSKVCRFIFQTSFRIITMISILLLTIVITILFDNSVYSIIIAISVILLPRFIDNIYAAITAELKKNYIEVVRLDGQSELGILNNSVFPNIKPAYYFEVVNIFIAALLTSTTLTFLGFGLATNNNELGIMMKDMSAIIDVNYWASIVPGLTILLIIILVNFLGLGLNLLLSNRE